MTALQESAAPVRVRPIDYKRVRRALADREWRLDHLYHIQDANGRQIRFVRNAAQRRFWSDLWYLNIVLKARQLGFCCDPSMRVLAADLRWVPIGSLAVGDALLSVDEFGPGGQGRGRKFRRGVVEGVREVFEDAFRLVMDNGVELIATGPHRHLCQKRGAVDTIWRSVATTRVGDRIRYVTTPWGSSTYEDGWIGGLIDGEGSLRTKPEGGFEITICQTPGLVLERARNYFATNGYSVREQIDDRVAGSSSKFGNKPVYKLLLYRLNEAFRLVGQTRPTRFVDTPWWEGKELPGKRSGQAWAKVVAIEPLGKRKMIDLQTSTKTFICEGFVSHNSTFIAVIILDACLFNSNTAAGVIDSNIDECKKKLEKVRFAFKCLPAELQREIPLTADNALSLAWANGSSVSVSTSHRGGTLQYLHVSEYGKIAVERPQASKEIRSGAFGTVHRGNFIFVESTAKGSGGDFHDLVTEAEQLQASGKRLAQSQFKLHFFAWQRHPAYVEEPARTVIDKELAEYFAELESKHEIKLSARQRAWYALKRRQIGIDEMYREYPSYPEEAFKVSREGAYFKTQMIRMREQRRIGRVPLDPSRPVHTCWDIGKDDNTAIWFFQAHGALIHLLDYYENSGEGTEHYARYCKTRALERGFLYGTHYGPHDLDNSLWVLPGSKAQVDVARELGIDFQVVPRVPNKMDAIEAARNWLGMCWIDEEHCALGIRRLDNYHKEWDEKRGHYKSEPVHDENSHGADALMTGACGFTPDYVPPPVDRYAKKKARRSAWAA